MVPIGKGHPDAEACLDLCWVQEVPSSRSLWSPPWCTGFQPLTCVKAVLKPWASQAPTFNQLHCGWVALFKVFTLWFLATALTGWLQTTSCASSASKQEKSCGPDTQDKALQRLFWHGSVTQTINWALSLTNSYLEFPRGWWCWYLSCVLVMLLVLPSGSGTMLSYWGAEPAWVFKVLFEISKQPHGTDASARGDQQLPDGRGSEIFSLDISVLEPWTEETAFLHPSFINIP